MSAASGFSIDDKDVLAALQELLDRSGPEGLAGGLAEIGEVLAESTKQRFATSLAPDGQRWEANAEATYISYIDSRKGFSAKTGKIVAKGKDLATNKHPLVESGVLADTIAWQFIAGGFGVEVGTNRIYGAMQQFGGKKADYPNLWGDIPARPFLGFSPDDKESALEILVRHLAAT